MLCSVDGEEIRSAEESIGSEFADDDDETHARKNKHTGNIY